MSERVLVTGAGGFIGSHLVEHLVREGHAVRTFVHYNAASNWHNLEKLPKEVLDSIDVRAGDIVDPYMTDRAVAGCDLVFHLAALIGIPYSYVAPEAYIRTNVLGTLNVLEACRRHDVRRLVHTSTSETYGTAQYVPIDERHPLVGQSPYSASKIAADKLVESYWLSFKTPVTVVRPFNTYGPRQSMRAIIPTIIGQALTQKELVLGNLDPVRDLTFVTDTASGFLCAAKSDKVLGEVLNLGVGSGLSVREIGERVCKILDREFVVRQEPARIRPAESEVMQLVSDNSKAKSGMGWSPKVDIDSGLQATVEYIRRHLGEYKSDAYVV